MQHNFLNRLGDWNPQLLREIKGRLTKFNVLLVLSLTLIGQFVLFQFQQAKLPIEDFNDPVYNRYCSSEKCVLGLDNNFVINWPLWWSDLFVMLSLISVFALLVAGTYMLIADLSKEDRRGTLNFIRLSPQSTEKILVGKLLGVPSLLYLLNLLLIPLHLAAGIKAYIPLTSIFGFYISLIASCFLFYSLALLFGLVSKWLGGFQAWLGSGVVLGLLTLITKGASIININDNPLAFFRLLVPIDLIISSFLSTYGDNIGDLQWFALPVGKSYLGLVSLMVLVCGVCSYWIWQGLKRCFRNPNATLLSKRQSYLMVVGLEVIFFGLWLPGSSSNSTDFVSLLCLNFLLCLGLIAALTPQRQALQDWARYRHQRDSKTNSLAKDLLIDEKSPMLVAMGVNIAIALSFFALWLLFNPFDDYLKRGSVMSLALAVSLIAVYAALTQLLLFQKNKNRVVMATSVISILLIFPPAILGIFGVAPSGVLGFWWLFSIAAPIVPIAEASLQTTSYFVALVGHFTILVLSSIVLTRQLKKAGESETKKLLSGRNSLPIS